MAEYTGNKTLATNIGKLKKTLKVGHVNTVGIERFKTHVQIKES